MRTTRVAIPLVVLLTVSLMAACGGGESETQESVASAPERRNYRMREIRMHFSDRGIPLFTRPMPRASDLQAGLVPQDDLAEPPSFEMYVFRRQRDARAYVMNVAGASGEFEEQLNASTVFLLGNVVAVVGDGGVYDADDVREALETL